MFLACIILKSIKALSMTLIAFAPPPKTSFLALSLSNLFLDFLLPQLRQVHRVNGIHFPYIQLLQMMFFINSDIILME